MKLLRPIIIAAALFGGLVSAQAATLHAIGDSITVPTGASVPANGYAQLLAADLGQALDDEGVSTNMVFDAYDRVLAVNMATGDKATIMLGTNDEAWYSTDPTKVPYYEDGFRSSLVRLSAQWKAATPTNGVTFSGAYSVGPYTRGIYGLTGATGKAVYTAQGHHFLFSTLRQVGNTSTFQIKVNSTIFGPYATNGAVTTILGRAYGPYGIDLATNSGDTVEIDALNADANNPVYVDWISDFIPKATVVAINTPNFVGTLGGPLSGGTLANVATYNTALAGLVSELAAAGLDVHLADVKSLLGPSNMADGVHPNDSGHLIIKAAAYTAFTGTVAHTYTPTTVSIREDGLPFINVNGTMKQIVTTP